MHLAVFQASHQTGPFWQFRHEFENLGGALSSFLFAFCPHEVLRICNSQRELYDGQHLLPSCHRPKDCKFTPYTGVYLCRANIYWGTSLYVLFEVSSEFTCPNSYTKSSITSQMWQSWIFWGELFGDLLKRGVTLFILTDKSTTCTVPSHDSLQVTSWLQAKVTFLVDKNFELASSFTSLHKKGVTNFTWKIGSICGVYACNFLKILCKLEPKRFQPFFLLASSVGVISTLLLLVSISQCRILGFSYHSGFPWT